MITVDISDPKLIENVKALKFLRKEGIWTDEELQSFYDKQVERDKEELVPVVRCKDCTYKIKNAFGLGVICDKIGAYMPTENSFCSFGKKDEGGVDE